MYKKEFVVNDSQYLFVIDSASEISFYKKILINDHDFGDSYYIFRKLSILERKSSIKVFSEIKNITIKYIKKYKPWMLKFKTDCPRKRKIYKSIIQKIKLENYMIVEDVDYIYVYRK